MPLSVTSIAIRSLPSDPFPGTRNVYELTNYSTESNMLTDKGYPSPLVLHKIKEENGMISFTLEEDPDASDRPYTFCLKDIYSSYGIDEDGNECKWDVHTDIVQTGGRDKLMIYDLVPDTKNIAASYPKYASGLGAAYAVSGDKKKVFIEPYRVALLEDYGVWLVDFNDLENGGSGAIILSMNPWGELSLSNPSSVLGYCFMPKNSAVVIPDKIIERFSLVKDIRFDALSGIDIITATDKPVLENAGIFNMQGIRVNNPQKGQIYIIGGKKEIY